MLFNSLQFLIYFPMVTTLYFLLPHRWRWLLLLAASCYFYMCFIPIYLLILVVTITVDYLAGIGLDSCDRWQPVRPIHPVTDYLDGFAIKFIRITMKKRVLLASILCNVGMLFFFKYFNFANSNIAQLATWLDWNYPIKHLAIILPIGLSFHTFQSMSYTIEVYRNKFRAERHFGLFALYVMFYPQLVAGPIERPQNLLPQFHQPKTFDYALMKSGLKLMTWGFFKKLVIADRMADYVNSVYNAPSGQHGLTLLVATLLFAVQIYCDFSGYSDIAIGAARVMGFKLMTNFNIPYIAMSIKEFWGRWHISLSTWFKDYLYFPLGGNRVSPARHYLNLFIVFLVSGIWHGANWTFVIWGALHGVYQILTVATERASEHFRQALGISRFPTLERGLRIAITFALVCFAWIFFRAATIGDAWQIIRTIATATHFTQTDLTAAVLPFSGDNTAVSHALCTLALLGAFMLAELWGRPWYAKLRQAPTTVVVRQFAWASCVVVILTLGRFAANSFIYFQF